MEKTKACLAEPWQRAPRGLRSCPGPPLRQAPEIGVKQIPPGEVFLSEYGDDIIKSSHLLCIYLCQATCFAYNIPVNPQDRKAQLLSR